MREVKERILNNLVYIKAFGDQTYKMEMKDDFTIKMENENFIQRRFLL